MNSITDDIKRTGRSNIFKVSWSDDELSALRTEGADKLQRAAKSRMAQFDLHHTWPRLLDLITDTAIVTRLAEVFGDDSFQLVETRLYPKPPSADINWHIDFQQLECFEPSLLNSDSDDFHSITTWLALDNVSEEMGALKMVHYKYIDLHKIVRARRGETGQKNAQEVMLHYRKTCETEADRMREYVETLPMKAGEFCLFDPRDLHTGGANRTDRLRLGMVMRYCANNVHVNPKFSKHGALRIISIRNGKPVINAAHNACADVT